MSSGVCQSALRRVHVSIDEQALQHNLAQVKKFAPHSRVMAVIKANAYGHGILRAAQALDQADYFAVASPGEALYLRQQGIAKPLLVIHGFSSLAELDKLAAEQIEMVIHQPWQVDLLERFSGPLVNVWLKIDTGMHRLGFSPADVDAVLQRLASCRKVDEIVLISHFANADEPEHPLNSMQLAIFQQLVERYQLPASMANSAAIMQLPASHFDMVRPGIMLYGSSPLPVQSAAQFGLQPVMQVTSTLLAIKTLNKGDAIGYGSSWVCPQTMSVGIVAAGYGDGYPRHASSSTPVWLHGKRCHVLGRVSMDSLCIDLRQQTASPGDRVVLWGKELSVDEVARGADTIAYELLCKMGSMHPA